MCFTHVFHTYVFGHVSHMCYSGLQVMFHTCVSHMCFTYVFHICVSHMCFTHVLGHVSHMCDSGLQVMFHTCVAVSAVSTRLASCQIKRTSQNDHDCWFCYRKIVKLTFEKFWTAAAHVACSGAGIGGHDWNFTTRCRCEYSTAVCCSVLQCVAVCCSGAGIGGHDWNVTARCRCEFYAYIYIYIYICIYICIHT